MWKVKKTLLIDACESAKRYYPDEFMCFLSGNKKTEIIDEIILLPTYSDENSASISEAVIPIDDSMLGTLHSHPDSSFNPSDEDKKFFSRYKINAILGYPFFEQNIAFYNEKGKRIQIELI